MKHFRYNTSARWFKGNTHTHSTRSDGGKAPEELAALYGEAGYDFLCITDHWLPSAYEPHQFNNHLLMLNGVELDGNDDEDAYFHVVALGDLRGISRDDTFPAAFEKARAQGAVLVLAHPHWTGNSTDEVLRHPFDAVEVFNYISGWAVGKEFSAYHWDAMLEHFPDTLGIASDDAHIKPNYPCCKGGWIQVNAEALTTDAILKSIKSGNFYSSTGPSFHHIWQEGNEIHFTCSPVRFARSIGPRWHGKGMFDEQNLITAGVFELRTELAYQRLEIEDAYGKKAWSNNVFRESTE